MDVLITEVGPRDGLQSVSIILPTPLKCDWIDALAAAGFSEIEIGSFVSPKIVPQMADTGDVAAHCRRHHALTLVALVPNLQGAQKAIGAGLNKITVPISASPAHSLANVRKTPLQMVEELRRIIQATKSLSIDPDHRPSGPGPVVEVGISTAFGCTIQGVVSEDSVIELAIACADAGAASVGLSDTTGMANPASVRRLFSRLQSELGKQAGAAHLHNTRGLGLANALAAFEVGVRAFDSSLAGLGGCPYAPGASGNVVTEDLVFMFESMGVKTGIDFNALMHARRVLQGILPQEPIYGMTPAAGLPKGFEWPSNK